MLSTPNVTKNAWWNRSYRPYEILFFQTPPPGEETGRLRLISRPPFPPLPPSPLPTYASLSHLPPSSARHLPLAPCLSAARPTDRPTPASATLLWLDHSLLNPTLTVAGLHTPPVWPPDRDRLPSLPTVYPTRGTTGVEPRRITLSSSRRWDFNIESM